MSILHTITFQAHILKRALRVMTRKSRNIRLLYVNYENLPGESGERVIKYRFRNALWYKTEISGRTLDKKILLPKEIDKTEINLEVQGLFRRNNYTIQLEQDHVHVIKLNQN